MMRLLISLIILVYLPATHAAADGLDAFLNQLTAQDEIPAMALAVRQGESVRYYYKGQVAGGNNAKKIDEADGFYIGSLSKIYTASIILKMAENGALLLDDKIADYMPAHFEGARIDNYYDVTIRHILESKSGLVDHHGTSLLQDVYLNNLCLRDEVQAARYIYDIPASHKAGSAIGYSSLGYVLLGAVIKKHYQIDDLALAFQKGLFLPLGLRNSAYDMTYFASPVYGLERYDSNFPAVSTALWKGCMRLADGGIIASVSDVDLFMNALLRERSYLSGQFANEMIENTYALEAWDLPLGKAYGHKGRFPGFVSASYYIPERDIIISLLINSGLVKMEQIFEAITMLIDHPEYETGEVTNFLRQSYQDEIKELDMPEMITPPPL